MEKHINKVKIEDVAYHEAGHVFVFWKLNFLFEFVTIIKEKDDLGRVETYKPSRKPILVPMLNVEMEKELIIKEITIKEAGPISENNYTKKPPYLAKKDNDEILNLALRLGNFVKNEEFNPLIKQIRSETTVMITQNWKLVKVIAKKLLRKKELTRKEIESLMKKHY